MKIQQVAQETAQKCSTMMQTYMGPDLDSSEAIEFLCLAEGGEVTHYEVLAAMSKKLGGKMKNTRKLSTTVDSILREEKNCRFYPKGREKTSCIVHKISETYCYLRIAI